jgi:hypothetical protein
VPATTRHPKKDAGNTVSETTWQPSCRWAADYADRQVVVVAASAEAWEETPPIDCHTVEAQMSYVNKVMPFGTRHMSYGGFRTLVSA